MHVRIMRNGSYANAVISLKKISSHNVVIDVMYNLIMKLILLEYYKHLNLMWDSIVKSSKAKGAKPTSFLTPTERRGPSVLSDA